MALSVINPLERGSGLEELQFAAFEVLVNDLNAEIAVVEDLREALDQRQAELRGVGYQPVTVEEIETDHFYPGHTPSLILDSTPIDSYPCVTVMAYAMDPEAFDAQADQFMAQRDRIYIETLVKASPNEGELVCDKRVKRTIDAIHRVLAANQTLNGAAFGIGTPRVNISEVFTRPRSDDDDTDWFWQAGRIEYGVTKFAPFT